MTRKLPVKIAAVAAGLVLTGGAAAVASGSTADTDDPAVTTEVENTGVEAPTTEADQSTVDDHADESDAVDDDTKADDESTDDVEGTDAPDDESGPPEGTHGAEVSAVAHDDSNVGRDHGKAVSEVARGDHGDDAADEASDDEATEDDDATTTDAPKADEHESDEADDAGEPSDS